MIIKFQSILFPYARQREEKKPVILSKKDKVNADRIVVIFLFILTIAAAIIFS
ncbi:MAG: hypothetical protein V4663_08775 [Bacteroidota bacterium]